MLALLMGAADSDHLFAHCLSESAHLSVSSKRYSVSLPFALLGCAVTIAAFAVFTGKLFVTHLHYESAVFVSSAVSSGFRDCVRFALDLLDAPKLRGFSTPTSAPAASIVSLEQASSPGSGLSSSSS